jgi:hypothetical protein
MWAICAAEISQSTALSRGERAMIILIWLLLLSPTVPLGLFWSRGFTSSISRLAAAVMTISYAWLALALLSPLENRLLGPAYSHLRVVIPYTNVAVVTAMMILLLIRGERKTALLASAGIILCWLYVRVISFAV